METGEAAQMLIPNLCFRDVFLAFRKAELSEYPSKEAAQGVDDGAPGILQQVAQSDLRALHSSSLVPVTEINFAVPMFQFEAALSGMWVRLPQSRHR